MEKIIIFLKQFGILLAVAVVGVGIVVYGLWGALWPEQAKVEIVKSQTLKSDETIIVDVAGAVEKPGLYKLSSGSRVGDALVIAGGLSEKADRVWVGKSVNLAEVLKDGGKVYIPAINSAMETYLPAQAGSQSNTLGITSTKVNINMASLGELDYLTGIGEARAKAIVDSRPYSNLEELVSKAKIPQSVYDKIKDSLSIY